MKIITAILTAFAIVSGAVLTMAACADEPIKLIGEGELRILTNPIYPPMGFVNPDTGIMDGFDIDLVTAIAEKMELTPIFIASSFADLSSALQTGRGYLVIAGLSDNAKRQESMDFVIYMARDPIFFTIKERAQNYPSAEYLCGRIIAGSRNGISPNVVPQWSDRNCTAKGKEAVIFEETANSDAACLGLKQERYDAVV